MYIMSEPPRQVVEIDLLLFFVVVHDMSYVLYSQTRSSFVVVVVVESIDDLLLSSIICKIHLLFVTVTQQQ